MTTLADEIAKESRRAGYGTDVFILAVTPNGSSFLCRPTGPDDMSAERLSREDTVAAIIEIFGLSAFRGQ
ncbi:hypothetical protein CN072_29400 [Sinorhizobium meliloti]|uniref:hypothetical protein n=1 Tax=Rhizobium meliloti TaxID=382 RepID=UPI000FD550C2|nr:hypothetical protein [Sinorhizobium meliloti]MDX0572109.1 hypothetical protein [Sinorhizobium medicae]MDX0671892.1 hypothetical protein [Sinorhizobium medicae]MDX0709172.1 hypothetical protein [Sinorhizobium medicae]RVP79958.1 hypothetical protein CN072_29400 [Sinorhizobium meliloti]